MPLDPNRPAVDKLLEVTPSPLDCRQRRLACLQWKVSDRQVKPAERRDGGAESLQTNISQPQRFARHPATYFPQVTISFQVGPSVLHQPRCR